MSRTLNLLRAPSFQYSIIPPFLPRRVRREQKMPNEPNSPKAAGRPGRRRGKCAKRTQFRPVGENRSGGRHPPNAPNEPNFVRPGLPRKRKCAKRTQFLDCGFRIANCGLRTDVRWDACPAVRHVGVAEGEMYETESSLGGVSVLNLSRLRRGLCFAASVVRLASIVRSDFEGEQT